MNNYDLNIEMERNASDKQLANAELDASRNKWIEYLVKNKDKVCAYNHPIVVRKKRMAKLNDFIDKIKTIFGLKPRKGNVDGIEAYLQYSDGIE